MFPNYCTNTKKGLFSVLNEYRCSTTSDDIYRKAHEHGSNRKRPDIKIILNRTHPSALFKNYSPDFGVKNFEA